MRLKAYITKDAFVTMVLAAIDVYKKECLGVLLGTRNSDLIVIDHAVVYQSAVRKYSEVNLHHIREKRMRKSLQELTPLKDLGDFHSHPQYGSLTGIVMLNKKEDAEFLEENPDKISVIIAINDKKKRRAWETRSDGSISGSIGDYNLRIAAYYFDTKQRIIKKAKISCPYALGIESV